MVIFLSSCIEEDPQLVNPPSKADKIFIRYINFSGDYQAKKMSYDNGISTNIVNYSKSTVAANPPADSSHISIININNQTEYKTSRLLKFSPNIYYSYVSLPGPLSQGNPKPTDTIFTITSSLAMPNNTTDAYIKLVNLYPDSLKTFSLMLGCPSSNPIFSGLRFMQQTSPSFVRTGLVAFSIVSFKDAIPEIIGTYALQTKERGQYAVVIGKNQSNGIGVYTLDELDLTTNSFKYAQIIDKKYTNFKSINVSNKEISVIHNNSNVISQNQPLEWISKNHQIVACESQSKDTITILSEDQVVSNLTYSFEVLENYLLVVADSGKKLASKSIILPPTRISNYNNKALIRVVNLAWDFQNIDVSIGSRQDKFSGLGYSSGNALVKNLEYGKYSEPILINEGSIPLSIFTSFEPSEMLDNSNSYVNKNKEYLLVVTQNQKGELLKYMIGTELEDTNLQSIEKTSFIQILNAVTDVDLVNISINNDIESGKLFYTNVLATNLLYRNNNVTVKSDKSEIGITINPKVEHRYTLILTGTSTNLDYVLLENKIEKSNPLFAQIRFINTIQDIQQISIVEKIKDTSVIAILPYKEYTFYNNLDKIKRYTYYFFDNQTMKSFLNFNFEATLGKKYSLIIAGGSKTKNKYSSILIQEY